MNNPLRSFSTKLFGKIKPQAKAIGFLVLAILAGRACDTHFNANFPIFTLCFTLVGLMIMSIFTKKST